VSDHTILVIEDEAALRRPIGGKEVMRAQLVQLIEATEEPQVTLQGHSKNPSGYGFDCVGAIFPEVFAGLRDGPAKASDQSDGVFRNVAKGRAPALTRQRSSFRVTSRT